MRVKVPHRDPIVLDMVSDKAKRYAVEVMAPNGAWITVGLVDLEPGEAVQITTRVREVKR